MKRYRYKARSDKGELLSGEVEANSPEHAVKLIRQRGYVVIALTPIRTFNLSIFDSFKNRISKGDVTTFTRQFATMINAGLPITEALLILRTQSGGSMQRVISALLADVEEGQSLSSSMVKYPNAFSKTYVALVKSGEVGGVLDDVLGKLADDMEKQQEFTGKVKGAMLYPIIVVVGMIIVALVMMIFVIPRMTSLYEQFEIDLPITTKILITTSRLSVKFWPMLLVGIFVVLWWFKIYTATKKGRKRVDELIFKLPVIGDLQRQIILTDFTRTMSLMVGSGVSILEALNVASEVSGNLVLSEALADTAKMVEKGFPLAFAFSKHPEAFPFLVSQMIAVGEETGKMDEVLAKLSHVFEIESEQKVKALTTLIEPIILIVLGVGVAFLVISIIMPIYSLTTNL